MEEMFLLCYGTDGGLNPQYVETLTRQERLWFLKRLLEQIKREKPKK